MSDINPSLIMKNYQEGKSDKSEAMSGLISIIRDYKNLEYNVESLKILNELNIPDEDYFKVLESLLFTHGYFRHHSNNIFLYTRQIVLEELSEKFPAMTIEVLGEYLEFIRMGPSPEYLVVIDHIWWAKGNKLSLLKTGLYNLLKESIEKYEGEGVVRDEAVMLALIELYWCEEVRKLNYQGDIYGYQVDHYCDYRVNSNGHIIGLYVSAHSDPLQLFSIIDNIDRLKYFEELMLAGCSMRAIPESIINLNKLSFIDFNGNNLEKIPSFIEGLTNLRHLDLSYNKIEKIPETIGNLKNLELLNLIWNKIKEIPKSIKHLKNLRTAWLRDNEIEVIPEEIGKLTSLEDLGLDINKLKEIPESIRNLGSLKQLDYFLTKIKELEKKI